MKNLFLSFDVLCFPQRVTVKSFHARSKFASKKNHFASCGKLQSHGAMVRGAAYRIVFRHLLIKILRTFRMGYQRNGKLRFARKEHFYCRVDIFGVSYTNLTRAFLFPTWSENTSVWAKWLTMYACMCRRSKSQIITGFD